MEKTKMQARRREDQSMVSPSKLRSRQERFGTGHDTIANPRSHSEVVDLKRQVRRRSVSPCVKVEDSRRVVLDEGKTGLAERREYSWHLGVGRKEVMSGSPQHVQELGKPQFDKGLNKRRYDYIEDKKYKDNKANRAKHVYGHEYEGATSRINKDDYIESRVPGFNGHGIQGQKLVSLEDETIRGAYRVCRKWAPTSFYGDTNVHVPLPSDSMNFLQFEDEEICYEEPIEHEKPYHWELIEHEEPSCRDSIEHDKLYYQESMEQDKLTYLEPIEHEKFRHQERTKHEQIRYREASDREKPRYPETLKHENFRHVKPLSSNKLAAKELHDEGEKPVLHARDISHATMLPASHSKDIAHTTQFKDFAGTSSGGLRSKFPSKYKEGMSLPASYDYPRSDVEFTESLDYKSYDQRSISNVKDFRAGKRIITTYPHSAYRSSRLEYDDYHDFDSQEDVNDDNVYMPDDICREMMPPCSQLDYEHVCADLEHRESFRPDVMHPVRDRISRAEGSLGRMRTSAVRMHQHPIMKKEVAVENLDASGIYYTPKQEGEHLGSNYIPMEVLMRVSRDSPAPNSGVTEDHQFSHVRSVHGFGRDAGPWFPKDRIQDVSVHDDFEMHGLAVKRQKMGDFSLYEPTDAIPKRNYGSGKSINRHDTRPIFSQEWDAPSEFEDPYDNGKEWIDENMDVSPFHGHQGFGSIKSSKERIYDGPDQAGDSVSEDWFQPQDSVAYSERNSVRHYRSGVKFVKGHSKSGSLSWHNSYQTKRTGFHRQQMICQSNDDYDETANEDDEDPSKDWPAEPSEESEEFKQLVDAAFLMYSKRLNLYAGLQRRYKEQGKAGSLFCIVCGRRSSKEFLDTQRLVTHAFMSHKVGLRAKHLGLHKAICVLMGWNTFVPCDTVTWVPEVLPDSEALGQKEDLILWPPLVIIHNISMSNNNPEYQKVVPIENVASFVRGKGFVEGKMKVALGKPADQSVILLKFLGTFTGLGDAEKIHKYFSENGQGREEFERKTSKNSKSSSDGVAGIQGDKSEEQLLYGYMGIADDLDRLDFNTKQWITIKSKKEIEDLANAPVKTDDR